MAVMHDYVCLAHGNFESRTARCPHGCSESMVQMVFLKAPAAHTSGKSKFIDRKMNDIATQFGDTAVNDRYDTSRIDMSQSGDIQQKRLRGETYALPVDPKQGVAPYLGMTGGGDNGLADRARDTASQAIRSSSIIKDDLGKTTI